MNPNKIYNRSNVFCDGLDEFQKEFIDYPFLVCDLIEALRFEKKYKEADIERERLKNWGFTVTYDKTNKVEIDWFNRFAWSKFFNNCELE